MDIINLKNIFFSILFILIFSKESLAVRENVEVSIEKDTNGLGYWETSTIREWLNSEDEYVRYTQNRPSSTYVSSNPYDKEAGFLTNFSDEEKEAIAVTKRRIYTNNDSVKEKGNQTLSLGDYSKSMNFSFNNFDTQFNNYKSYYTNDKVFLMSIFEYYKYIECNGISPLKKFLPTAQRKFNNYGNVNWGLESSGINNMTGGSFYYVDTNSQIKTIESKYSNGIVPLLHVKPSYTFKNGVLASDLNINDKVEFGTYNGDILEWDVLNKTNDGYILLICSNVIDYKPINSSKNKILYSKSKYIDFDNYDIDISSNFKIYNKENDEQIPLFTVINEEEIYSRHTEGYTLNIEFNDDSGIKFITTPDGSKVYNTNNINLYISENKNYELTVCDNSNNYRNIIIPISNINLASQVLIETSSNGWTNKDVTVKIEASNKKPDFNGTYIQNGRDKYWSDTWKNHIGYNNRKIRITGSVELINYSSELGNLTTTVGFYMKKINKTSTGDFRTFNDWTSAKSWKLTELDGQGEVPIDVIYTVPNSFFSDIKGWTQISYFHYDDNYGNYNVKYSNLKAELLDADDFGIDKIVLPDGTEVYESTITDVLSEEGEYTYTVYDSNGVVTEKTVTVLIDKVPPSINFDYDDSFTNTERKLTIRASDDRSGISKIVLPNGIEINSDTYEYNVWRNETLTFKAYDNAGNVTTKSITINNIDNEITGINIRKNPTGIVKDSLDIIIEINDPSGIEYIINPDGNKINSNTITYTVYNDGIFKFIARDGAGNEEAIFVEVSDSFDKDNPIINVDKDNNWTNQGVQININTRD